MTTFGPTDETSEPMGDAVDATGDDPAPAADHPSTPAQRPKRRRRRLLILAAAVVLAAGGGIGGWQATSGGGNPTAGLREHQHTRIVHAVLGTMTESVSAEGIIEPAQVENLNFAVSGVVTAVDVGLDQQVTTGQTLATVATTALVAQVDSATAQLSSAQAQLTEDQAQGQATAEIAADKDAIVADQAQLATSQKQLTDATLTSPITGTVAEVELTVGQAVTSGSAPVSQAREGTGENEAGAEVLVVSTDQYVVDATVDQTVVGQLAVGQAATVTASGSPQPETGTVSFVSMVPNGETGIPSYPVIITVTGTPAAVYAGSQAQAAIAVQSLPGVVEIPTGAVTYKSGRPTVTVVSAGGATSSVSVGVGITSSGMTQITQGLSAGTAVIEKELTVSSSGGSKGSPSTGGRGGARIVYGATVTGT